MIVRSRKSYFSNYFLKSEGQRERENFQTPWVAWHRTSSHDPEIVTWAKTKSWHLAHWATQMPHKIIYFKKMFLCGRESERKQWGYKMLDSMISHSLKLAFNWRTPAGPWWPKIWRPNGIKDQTRGSPQNPGPSPKDDLISGWTRKDIPQERTLTCLGLGS